MAINSRLTLSNQQYLAALEQAGGALARFVGESSIRMQAVYRETDYLNRGLNGGINRLSNDLKTAGQNLSTYVTLPLVALGTAAISAFAKIDSLNRGLDSMTGSSSATTKRVSELLEVSKLPGLGFEEAVQGDIRLRAVGISAKLAKDVMLQFGNAIATTGGGKIELGTVLTQLSQMSSKGKVLAEDLKPILNASPLVAKAIKDMFGTVDSESVSAKLKAMGKDSNDFIKMLVDKLSELPRVTGGIGNAIETTGDSVKISLSAIGEGIDKAFDVTGKLNAFGESLLELSQDFKTLDPTIQKTIVGIAAVVAAAGPAVIAIGYLTSSTTYLAIGFKTLSDAAAASLKWIVANPYIAAGVALAALGAYVYYAANKTEELTTKQKALKDVMGQAQAEVITETEKVKALIEVARSDVRSKEEKIGALKKLNEISPQYFGKLTLETIQTNKAEEATKRYTDALLKNALAKGAEAKASELGTKLIGQKDDYDSAVKEYNNAIGVLRKSRVPVDENKLEGGFKRLKDNITDAKNAVTDTENAIKSLGKYIVEAPVTKTAPTINTGSGGGATKYKSEPSDKFTEYLKEELDKKKKLEEAWSSLEPMANSMQLKISATGYKLWSELGKVSEGIKKIDFQIKPLDMSQLLSSIVKAKAEFFMFKKESSDLAKNLANMSISISGSLRNAVAEGLSSFGEFIGGLAVGTMKLSDLPAMFGSVLADLASSIGKAMIAFGTAALAAQLLITNPYLAIAAGVALIALSAGLKGSISKSVSSATGGGSSASSYSPSSSYSGATDKQRAIVVEVKGTTSIKGNDLYISYQNASRAYTTKR